MVGQKNQILKVDNKSAITRLFDRKFGFFWNLEIGFKDSKYIPIFWDQIFLIFLNPNISNSRRLIKSAGVRIYISKFKIKKLDLMSKIIPVFSSLILEF